MRKKVQIPFKTIIKEKIKTVAYLILRQTLKIIFSIVYRIEVKGLDHLKNLGERNILISNHVSALDPILLALYIPGRPVFALNRDVAKKWWIKPVLALSDVFELDPSNSFQVPAMIDLVKEGRTLLTFSEGRVSETNSLMKIYETPALIADKAKADIIPIMIDGPQYTIFSKMKGKLTMKTFPKIYISIFDKVRLKLTKESPRERRDEMADQLYKIMAERLVMSSPLLNQTLFEAATDAAFYYGKQGWFKKLEIIEDQNRNPIGYSKFLTGAHVLGNKFAQTMKKGERVGLMMPNVTASPIAFYALSAYGIVPAMINFSSGADSVLACCKAATLKKIITARAFIKQAELEGLIDALEENNLEIIYIEDVAKSLKITDKIYGLLLAKFGIIPTKVHKNDPAVVLFTSGSEGLPKGVVLSHQNILANITQIKTIIPLNQSDIVFNALPLFHSFGAIICHLPLMIGVKMFLYPSPLHYKVIPQLFYEVGANLLVGTDTFMRAYAENAHPYDFYNIKYAVLGGEKCKQETRDIWQEKFGVRILEGYGVTECAPLIAVNTPMHFKIGSVGRVAPGMETKIKPIPGIEEGGELMVKGLNVMLGYLKVDEPGVLQPPANGWYDTGDIVDIDDHGFIFIKGRAKRFAKIGGEMVSLTAAEDLVNSIYHGEGINHAIIAVNDDRKGEKLVLITSAKNVEVSEIIKVGQARKLSELMFPRVVEIWDNVPLMATGKIDYQKVIKEYKSKHGL